MKKVLSLIIIIHLYSYCTFAQGSWFKAQMHCHSTNSDGDTTPRAVAQTYFDKGNSIIFITDHDFMTVSDTINIPGMLCINGEETHPGGVHINGFFLHKQIIADSYTLQSAIDSVHAQGGLVQLNHPIDPHARICFKDIMPLQNLDFMEICNFPVNLMYDDDQMLWDSLLTAGKKVYGTASDDEHVIMISDNGYVYVFSDTLTREAVFSSMKAGYFYASCGIVIDNYEIDSNIINVSCTNCKTIKFYGTNHTVLKSVRAKTSSYTITNEPYVRVYLEDDGDIDLKKRAWTQPLFHDELGIKAAKKPESAMIFPNPATGNPTLRYYVSLDIPVCIELFDIAGHKISEISNVDRTPGYHETIINTNAIGNGMYFCVITSGNSKMVRKLLLNK